MTNMRCVFPGAGPSAPKRNPKRPAQSRVSLAVALALTANSSVLVAGSMEEDLDSMILNSGPTPSAQDAAQNQDSPSDADYLDGFHWDGYLLNDDHFSLYKERNGLDQSLVKAEARLRLNLGYETEHFNAFVSSDTYLAAQQNRSAVGEGYNAYSLDPDARFELQEAYVETHQAGFNVKLGKQLFQWGTGDAFHVTNYFDQLDLREMYLVDEDDRYRGVPAISAQYLIDDFALEAVVAPVFAPPLMPGNESFWAVEPQSTDGIQYRFEPDNDYRNRVSAGLRAGGVVGNFDYHFSVFNGISNSLLFQSRLEGTAIYLFGNNPSNFTAIPTEVIIDSSMLYDRITSFGFDAASSIGKFSYRLEVAYTPNMIAVVMPTQEQIIRAIYQRGLESLPMATATPFAIDSDLLETRREPFVSWVLGMDYNYRGANGFFLVEWVRAQYLKNRDLFVKPLINEAILLRWEDKFLNESLEMEVSTIFGSPRSDVGYIFNPHIGWNFKNGLTASLDLFLFKQSKTDDDLMFELVENKDVIATSLKYEF